MADARFRLKTSLPVSNTLGEGIVYDHRLNSIWWTDIRGCQMYCYCLNSEQTHQWQTPYPVTSFGLTSIPYEFVVAFNSGFARYNLETFALNWLHKPEPHFPGNRLNDGKVDPMGRFWAGSMVEQPEFNPPDTSASLYCLDHKGGCKTLLGNLQISNGLCWSPDKRYLYHADSPAQKIIRYPFESTTGAIGTGKLFAQTKGEVYPDGSCTDQQGGIWNAQWGGAQVIRYNQQGQPDLTISLPVSQPTCVALSTHEQPLLFVTSAKEGLTPAQRQQQPQAGDVFIFEVQHQGIPEPISGLTL